MDVAAFLDPLGLAIVVGGSAALAAMRSTRDDIARAFAALGPCFTADPQADGHAARAAVGRIAHVAEARSLTSVDRIVSTRPFLRRAARRLAEAPSAAAFAAWGAEELAMRAERHEGAQGVWRALADAAPAMGLAGTVIGLIRMFAAMDDPGRIGPAMALAMLTTLYGVVLANLVAAPVAGRLERLSHAELAWQRRTIGRLVRIAEAEMPAAVAAPAPAPVRQAA